MNRLFIAILCMMMAGTALSQGCIENPVGSGNYVIPDGQGGFQPCPNAIPTALPFLTISPDARASGMGDVGIATSADANKMHWNPSMLAFAEERMNFSASYTPWLRDLGLNDVFHAYLSGYYKPDKLQTVGAALRYFSYGTINFRSDQGTNLGEGNPYEMEFGLSYARQLGQNFSAAIGAKYLYSNLAADQTIGMTQITAASAVAADIAFTWRLPLNMQSADESNLNIGLNIKNIGSKVSYTESAVKNSIPTNLGLGLAWESWFDGYNRLTLGLDINKLLVPTPGIFGSEGYDADQNGVPDHLEKSVIGGIFSSFGDAPNGFSEELREFTLQFGGEYWYNDQFAVRAGYFHEAQSKGNRKYLTLGLGIKYNVFGLDFSYLVATNDQNNPLNNTFRFSLLFNVEALAYDGDDEL